MTINEITASDKPMITAADAAEALGVSVQGLRETARTDPARLGFPVMRLGKKVLFPRIPFIRFLGYEPADENKERSNDHD